MTQSHVSHLLDTALGVPALVFGSLPPTGRDLDLLVETGNLGPMRAALSDAGYTAIGEGFVRFAGCSAYEIELKTPADWGLSAEATARLFRDAAPIEGYERLLEPSPGHSLLILARRRRGGLRVDDKRRKVIARALEMDGEAWEVAGQLASEWGVSAELADLRRAFERGVPEMSPSERSASHRRLRSAALRALSRGPGGVISLSGLDGSGKSTQAEHLRDALVALGIDATIEWTKIARDPSLRAIARPVKRLIRLLPTKAIPEAQPDDDPEAHLRNHPDGPRPAPDEGKRLRQRSRVLNQGWTFVVAVANSSTHRRTVRAHLRAGRVVICDRYVLDSRVHLRYRYGTGQRFRVQAFLIRWLSPRPIRSYLLDVAPETARTRKPEQYTVRDLQRLRSLYLEESTRLGTRRIDAECELDETCAELAEDAWKALSARKGSR